VRKEEKKKTKILRTRKDSQKSPNNEEGFFSLGEKRDTTGKEGEDRLPRKRTGLSLRFPRKKKKRRWKEVKKEDVYLPIQKKSLVSKGKRKGAKKEKNRGYQKQPARSGGEKKRK